MPAAASSIGRVRFAVEERACRALKCARERGMVHARPAGTAPRLQPACAPPDPRPAGAARAMLAVRSRGELALGFRAGPHGAAVVRNHQSGCLRMRMPRGDDPARPVAILMNTGGGLADGDRLVQSIAWEAGSAVTVTTQAAEKVYRAMDAGAVVETRLAVEAGAEAEWLPQETILFDRARLTRSTTVDVAPDARFLGLEAVILGRAASAERVVSGTLDDRWRIRRAGRLVYADALRLDGAVDALMARPALGGGARAMAVIMLVAPDAAALLAPVRAALGGVVGQGAASAWNGLLGVRLLAPDGAALRHDLILALAPLRGGRRLPRVWSC